MPTSRPDRARVDASVVRGGRQRRLRSDDQLLRPRLGVRHGSLGPRYLSGPVGLVLQHAALSLWQDGLLARVTNYPDLEEEGRAAAEQLAASTRERCSQGRA